MGAIRFCRTDPGSLFSEAFCTGGRLLLSASRPNEVGELRYALSRPDGMSGREIEAARDAAPKGSAARQRLDQTLPFLGARLGWFASVADGETLLTEAAARTVETDVDTQLYAAGFTPYLSLPNGKRVYVRHLTKSRSSNAFHLGVSATGVELTFERASTSDPLLALWLEDGEIRHAMPDFLATPEALIACAIAQANLALASGRTRRRQAA